jgi:hypothetical protein
MTKILYDPGNNFLKDFVELPNFIKPCENASEFQEQYKQVFSSGESKSAINIVYIWKTKIKIQRLRGESNILYIGKTSQSLYRRHHGFYKVESEKWNWERYKHILSSFGEIDFYYKAFDVDRKELESIERSLIWSYFEKHLEYPPLNARN